MKQIASLSCLAAALGLMSCASGVEIRPIKQPLADGRQPANVRLAEGNAQLALGNVGLAIEAYRKALREQPDSVEAMLGLANCYDRMGRADIARHHYEAALAVNPTNTESYAMLAQSLDAQGKPTEAAQVKTELAARVVAPEASREVPGSVPVLPPPPAQRVTVALAPPPSLPVAVERPAGHGMRLARLSLREVALVTRSEPRWEARTVAKTATSTTIRFDKKAQPAVTLLNAARVQGLAARTRIFLAGRGFAGARIGDAPSVQRQSAIVYSAADAARAERLAAQFGFALVRREGARGGVTILLGRDAARDTALRPTA
jgi:tetratricopeptide (TPR) repeat protein